MEASEVASQSAGAQDSRVGVYDEPPRSSRRWRLLLVSVVVLLMTVWGIGVTSGTIISVRHAYRDLQSGHSDLSEQAILHTGDFPMFYIGAKSVTSENRDQIYEKGFILDRAAKLWGLDDSSLPEAVTVWYRYYNPPFYLLALAPLSLLHIEVAYLVLVTISVVGLLCLGGMIGIILRWRQPTTLLLTASLPGFAAVPATIFHTQPTILIALLISGAFLALENNRSTLAAVLVTLAGMKPQWTVAAALPLLRERPRALSMLVLVGAVVVLLPFLWLGAGSIDDYVSFVLGRGSNDLSDPLYAARVLSWPGFMVALTGSSQPLASAILSLISVGLLVITLKQGDRHLTWCAAILSILIVLPHSHPQDWILTAPMAAFMLARPMGRKVLFVTVFLLFVGYLAVNTWVFASGAVVGGGQSLYVATPAAMLLLAWCAAIPLIEEGYFVRVFMDWRASGSRLRLPRPS